MRRVLGFLFLLFFLCWPFLCHAHSGRTDANGGHTDHSTGTYHYHHGYPAHQHLGSYCPYNFDDKTGQSSGASYQRITPTTPPRQNETSGTKSTGALGYLAAAGGGAVVYGISKAIRK